MSIIIGSLQWVLLKIMTQGPEISLESLYLQNLNIKRIHANETMEKWLGYNNVNDLQDISYAILHDIPEVKLGHSSVHCDIMGKCTGILSHIQIWVLYLEYTFT